jgi:hypothetical protein
VHAAAILIGLEAVLVAACYFLSGRSWERASLYLLGATAPLEVYRTTISNINLSLFRISLAIAVVVLAVTRVRERRAGNGRGWRPSRIEAVYLLLAFVVLASFADHGEVLFLGKRLLAVLLAGIVAIAVCAELARRTSVQTLATALVGGVTLPVIASFWQVAAPRLGANPQLPFLSGLPVTEGQERLRYATAALAPGAPLGDTGRLKGTLVDPNHFGIYLLFVLAVAIALSAESAIAGRRNAALAFGGFGGAAGATLIGTYSRSSWGATLVAIAIGLTLTAPLIRAHTTVRQRRRAIALVAVFLAVLVIPLGSTIASRLTPNSAVNSKTNAVHASNGKAGIDQFRHHPLFGIGVGGLGVVLDLNVRNSTANSTYVTVAAELGAIGLFVLLLTAGTAIDALARTYRRMARGPGILLPAVLLAAYAGFVAANVFYDELWWRDFHFIVVGLIVAVTARAVAARRAASGAPVTVHEVPRGLGS